MRWRLISTRRARLTASRVSRLSLLVAVAARARGGAVVTPAKTRGRLGNQLFQYASCYAIAVSANATFAARGVLGANARFAARGNEVCRTHEGCCGCGGEIPTASASERLDAPVWWDGRRAATEVARVRAAVEADGTTRFACSGYRQSASFFANDPWLAAKVRDEFSRWSAATRARASELWSRHVLPAAAALGAQVGGDNVKYVALYQRTGDVYSQRDGRASCLPDAAFYERAVKRFRIDLGPAANVFYVTSNHTKDWRSWLAPAVDRDARATIVAIDDPQHAEATLAALARCDAATFSHGTYSWWVGFLTGGRVLYDPGPWLSSGCTLSRLGTKDPRASLREHVPKAWVPLPVTSSARR